MLKLFILISSLTVLTLSGQNSTKKETPKKTEDKELGEIKKLSESEAKKSQKESKLKFKEYKYIADFVEKEYIKKFEKKLKSLEGEILKLQRKLQVTNSQKLKESITKTIKEKTAELESLKIWPKYHQAFLIKERSYENGQIETYQKARKYIKALAVRYQKLTATKFPNVRGIFYSRYAKQIKELREKKLNN